MEDTKCYFMKAQLPFNTKDAAELNRSYYDEKREERDASDLKINIKNLKELGVYDSMVNGKVLDVGCGTGRLIEHFARSGNGYYTGIDPIEEVIESNSARSGIWQNKAKYISTTFEEMEIHPIEKFSHIHTFFLFEHLVNPLAFIQKVNKMLYQYGCLIITCPNDSGFIPQRNNSRHAIREHRWLPDKKTIFKMLEDNEFEVMKWFTYGGYSTPRNIYKNIINKVLKKIGKGDVICLVAIKK